MTSRIIIAFVLLHAFTMFGIIVADQVPPDCIESKNYLCGTPLQGILTDGGDLSLSLNPLALVGTFSSLITTFGRLLWYDYAILNASDNVIVSLYNWGVKVTVLSVSLAMLYRAIPQAGSILARFLGR